MTLRLDDVGHRAGETQQLYQGLSLTTQPGAITAVIGPNGAGKSTLLRQLAGLEAPEHGRVWLGDRPVRAVPRRERAARIGYLPQHTPLYYDLRVREVVLLGRAPRLARFATPGEEDEAAATRALERVGMTDFTQRPVSTLSSGERQRVMLARLLATDTPIAILDEPTTALDAGHALAVLELCRELAMERGRTVIIAMHELELARRYASWVLCLDGAGGTRFGPTAEIMNADHLARVFRVEVQIGEHGIAMFPPPSPPHAPPGR